jgi:hypothetical protein
MVKQPRTVEATWIRHKSKSMPQVIGQQLVAAPYRRQDHNTSLLFNRSANDIELWLVKTYLALEQLCRADLDIGKMYRPQCCAYLQRLRMIRRYDSYLLLF